MEFSQELRDKGKEIFKEHGAEYTDAEADEALNNLAGLFDILWRSANEMAKKDRRLKSEPDGFPVEGQYSCLICGNSIDESTGWYHWGGQRCLTCHRAILDGTIPSFILKHRDSYFKSWKIADMLKVKAPTIRKMVREGKLKAREILNENGKVHDYIFLKKENLGFTERYSPSRKSYDRHRDKQSKKWVKEETKKLVEERRKMLEKATKR